MTKPNDPAEQISIDPFTGRPVNTDSFTLQFTGLSSSDTGSFAYAFTRILDAVGSDNYKGHGMVQHCTLTVTDGKDIVDKLRRLSDALKAKGLDALAPVEPAKADEPTDKKS